MPTSVAQRYTKWVLDAVTRVSKANLRVHNGGVIRDDMAIIFVVNHFTRMETLLLPYLLYRHTHRFIWSLAADGLFHGRVGDYLRATGSISTKDPERDTKIIRNLLLADHPWIIFPEGTMVKDKKVVDSAGAFRIYNKGMRRPPHKGAAVLALRSEYHRHRLACIEQHGTDDQRRAALREWGLESFAEISAHRTFIVPVNVTYFPIRADENVIVRLAQAWAKGLSPRAIEELSIEGTILSKDTDIDVTVGTPIDARSYLETPENRGILECGSERANPDDGEPHALINEAARRLMTRYMADIYRLTTVNLDHLLATLIRHQRARSMTERDYRDRIFLCVNRLQEFGAYRVHSSLPLTQRDLVYDEPNRHFRDLLALCVREGSLRHEDNKYYKNFHPKLDERSFDSIRQRALTYVIANEIEPLSLLTGLVREVAVMPRAAIADELRTFFLQEDQRAFENALAAHAQYRGVKPAEVGRPFLLRPKRIIGGIVLVHGYLSAPREVHAMAEYLAARGYAVYAVRLEGHGTAPEDLARTTWQDWYASLNRGYAVLRTMTDNLIVGGFSTGGVLALLAAARKGPRVRAVFAINAPLALQRFSARMAPSIVTMNSLLKRLSTMNGRWDYVEHFPEYKDVNYTRNPVTGVREVGRAMAALGEVLPGITVPVYVLQGGGDPLVSPTSAQAIFDRVGSPVKELTILKRDRHGIINGPGSMDVFEHIYQFLERVERAASRRRAVVSGKQAPVTG